MSCPCVLRESLMCEQWYIHCYGYGSWHTSREVRWVCRRGTVSPLLTPRSPSHSSRPQTRTVVLPRPHPSRSSDIGPRDVRGRQRTVVPEGRVGVAGGRPGPVGVVTQEGSIRHLGVSDTGTSPSPEDSRGLGDGDWGSEDHLLLIVDSVWTCAAPGALGRTEGDLGRPDRSGRVSGPEQRRT